MSEPDKIDFSGNLLMLKIQLAVLIERLIESEQVSFAHKLSEHIQRLYLYLNQLHGGSNLALQPMKVQEIHSELGEIENILLACKIGLGLPQVEKVLQLVNELKKDDEAGLNDGLVSDKTFPWNQN